MYLQGPQADFILGPDCYQGLKDWAEEFKLLLKGPPAGKNKAVKAKYVMLWAGKGSRTHIKSLKLTNTQRGDPDVLS